MRELPSHGRCHSAFLLAFSAALKPAATRDVWITSAASRSSYMAGAGDIAGTADILLRGGLVSEERGISIGPALASLSQQADRVTLVGIAALLLRRFPPGWLISSVVDGQFVPDLVPTDDMRRIEWLGTDLPPLILEVHASLTARSDETLRKAIGDAGELAIMNALRAAGHDPVHVAMASDAYGYDIEFADSGTTKRLEVKSAVEATAGRVLVTRNEFDRAGVFASDWRLVQIVFSSRIILTRKVTAKDVMGIREVGSAELRALAPAKSDHFRWTEGAEFRPRPGEWRDSELQVDEAFEVALI